MARRKNNKSKLISDPQWYKDAIIYELHIKAFKDSNGDGIGDIRGLISRLDYLENLGVTALWLLPFYPSPLRDDGYDIADYTDINPDYGTLNDFRRFLDEAHRRGLRVITELVLNHTSDQHPWFQKSRQSRPGSRWRDYYVWSDTPDKYSDARIIFQDFETSNWAWDPVAKAYFWHRFYSHQPDLNFDNPSVHRAMLNAIDFWLEMGVDGIRLDAVPYLYEEEDTNCENLPQTHTFLRKLRKHVDDKYTDRMLLAEANQWPEDAVAYFGDGDECHMAFNFPIMPRMFMAMQMEERFPIMEILDPPMDIPEAAQWAVFLRNHDELTLEMVTDEERDYMYRMYADNPRARINVGIRRRLAPLLGNNRRRIELMNILLLSLPGSPVLYYGDEIGMGDNYYLGDRDGVRTPMQWSPDRNAGFSSANPQRLYLPAIIDPEYSYDAINVELQDRNPSSLLWWMRRVVAMRKRYQAFSRGTCTFLSPDNHRVLAFIRRHEDEIVLIVINLSRFSQYVELDLSEYADMIPRELFSHNDFPRINEGSYSVTLSPHGHFWLMLRPAAEKVEVTGRAPRPLKLDALPEVELEEDVRNYLENRVMAAYLQRARWFGGKGRLMRKVQIAEVIRVECEHLPCWLMLVEIEYNEGAPDTYQVPMSFATKEKAEDIRNMYPSAIIGEVSVGDEDGVIYDAVFDRALQDSLLDIISGLRRLRGTHGRLLGRRARALRSELALMDERPEPRMMGAEQSNTSIRYGDHSILKLYRRLEEGPNPDAEVGRVLSQRRRFNNVPAYRGGLIYQRGKNVSYELGLLQQYVPNQGDAWSLMLHHVGRYLEYILSRRRDLTEAPDTSPLQMGRDTTEHYTAVRPLVSDYLTEMIHLLGERTGQMHLALAEIDDRDFAPEGFSQLYQRSIYQSMRNQYRAAIRLLEKKLSTLDDRAVPLARAVLEKQNEIVSRLRRLAGKKIAARKIRIHGDYHLGQVLFTGEDFVVIDFEGEPTRPLSERRLKRSVLRDVAGMVRSLHYAVYNGLEQNPSVRQNDLDFLMPWVKGWYHYAASHFLVAYEKTVGVASLVPRNAESANILLEAFLLNKAIYELSYELNNRPSWTIIPLKGILYVLQEESSVPEQASQSR